MTHVDARPRISTRGPIHVYTGTARARTNVVAAELTHNDFDRLARLRPDIAVTIYRNFANDVSDKLRRATAQLRDRS